MSRRICGAASAIVLSALLGLGGQAFAQSGKKTPDFTGTYNVGNYTSGGAAEAAKAGQTICAYACAPGAGSGVRPRPPEVPKYKSELLAKVKDLTARQVDEDPTLRCEPPGLPRIGPPQKIVQNDHEVVFLYNDVSGPFFRVIPTRNAKYRTDVDSTPLGDSTGRWEGDTLVVETTNFSDDTWLADNGAFHTAKLRVVERIRRVGKDLEWQATAHDPDVLAEPYVRTRTLTVDPVEIVVAPHCQDRALSQMQDKSYHGNAR